MTSICVTNILGHKDIQKALAEKKITVEEITKVVQELEGMKGFPEFAKNVKKYRTQTAHDTLYATYLKEHNKVITRQDDIFIQNSGFIETNNPNKIFESKVESPSVHAEGGKYSYANTLNSLQKKHKNQFDIELEGLDKVATDLTSQRDLAVAIDKLNKKEKITGVSESIVQLAQAVRRLNNYAVTELKNAGILIKERSDYITRQSHDPTKISGVSKEQWAKEIIDNLDTGKTFGDIKDPSARQEILYKIHKDIVEGKHAAGLGEVGRKRSLHFKDGASWFNYHTKYGQGTIIEAVRSGLDAAAKNEAMFSKFGADPGKNWLDLETKVGQKIKEQHGQKAYDKFMDTNIFGQKWYRDNMRQNVMGFSNHPVMGLPAKILQTGQSFSAMSKLQNAVFSTLTDPPITIANFIAKTGVNMFDGHARYLKTYTKNFTPSQTKQAGKILKMATDIEVADKYSLFEGATGGLAKLTNFAMKMSGLNATTRINRTTGAMMFSNFMGDMSVKDFGSLHKRFQAELSDFGIAKADWDIMRKAVIDFEGLKLMSPEKLSTLSDSFFRNSKHRRAVENKFLAFLSHNADMSSPQTGIRTRSLAFGGSSPNSLQGQMVRALMQFKSFPLQIGKVITEISTAAPDARAMSFLEGVKDKGNLSLFGMLATETFIAAGIGLMARDLAQGKTPRDMTKPENMVEAVSRGIIPLQFQYLMDAMKGDYANYGRNIFKDAAGPVYGEAATVFEMISHASKKLKGEPHSDLSAMTSKFIERNIPLIQNPLIKPFLYKSIGNAMLNYADPKRVDRINRSMERRDQQFIGKFWDQN